MWKPPRFKIHLNQPKTVQSANYWRTWEIQIHFFSLLEQRSVSFSFCCSIKPRLILPDCAISICRCYRCCSSSLCRSRSRSGSCLIGKQCSVSHTFDPLERVMTNSQCDQIKIAKLYKSCPKMISLEK